MYSLMLATKDHQIQREVGGSAPDPAPRRGTGEARVDGGRIQKAVARWTRRGS
jgi:hypothetical protein